jgi:hypothetical protein
LLCVASTNSRVGDVLVDGGGGECELILFNPPDWAAAFGFADAIALRPFREAARALRLKDDGLQDWQIAVF